MKCLKIIFSKQDLVQIPLQKVNEILMYNKVPLVMKDIEDNKSFIAYFFANVNVKRFLKQLCVFFNYFDLC